MTIDDLAKRIEVLEKNSITFEKVEELTNVNIKNEIVISEQYFGEYFITVKISDQMEGMPVRFGFGTEEEFETVYLSLEKVKHLIFMLQNAISELENKNV